MPNQFTFPVAPGVTLSVIEVPDNYFDTLPDAGYVFEIFEPKYHTVKEWKVIPNYSRYRISPRGEVYSVHLDRLMSTPVFGEYKIVNLYNDQKIRKAFHVHSLVAKLYVHNPNPDQYDQINHLDGDKLNNAKSNLKWTDASGNAIHAFRLGLNNNIGEQHHLSKLKTSDVLDIYSSPVTATELAVIYGVDRSTIDAIKNNETWLHVTQPKKYHYKGEMLTVPEISKRTGLSVQCIRRRLKTMPILKAATPFLN
jgi:hypothetical protein